VFQASVVGKPPQEDLWMGEAVQDMFTGVLKVIHPEIVDLWAYFEAGFHNLLVVAVRNRFGREARKTALGLLGTGQLSLTKCVLLVDEDVNPRDRDAVFSALVRNFDPAEDLLLIPGVPLDTLDFTSYTMNLGSKMVLDAQARPGSTSGNGAAPLTAEAIVDPRTFDDRIAEWRLAWGGVLVVKVKGAVGGDAAGWESARVEELARTSGATPGRQVIEALLRRAEYASLRLVVAVSEDVALADPRELLWGWFTRFDCARDLIPAAVDVRGAWVSVRGPLGIDATWKPGYPEPVANRPEVVARVGAYADALGIAGRAAGKS
jgi:4-hydroxy-3-polyprenylbenzoate decarboxylase